VSSFQQALQITSIRERKILRRKVAKLASSPHERSGKREPVGPGYRCAHLGYAWQFRFTLAYVGGNGTGLYRGALVARKLVAS
jgi:hypothetical protein